MALFLSRLLDYLIRKERFGRSYLRPTSRMSPLPFFDRSDLRTLIQDIIEDCRNSKQIVSLRIVHSPSELRKV